MATTDAPLQIGTLLRVFEKLAKAKRIVIVRIKDRFAKPSSGGWCDVMINFYVVDSSSSDKSGHICEVQIAHRCVCHAASPLCRAHAVS